jgi:tRNA(Ile)-lysidine synthase
MTVEERVRATGVLVPGEPVCVLLSGGRDSVCLLGLAVRIAGSAFALHVNYGLRDSADADEEHCRALSERLGLELEVRRPRRGRHGNLQAWAREERYAAAAEVVARRGGVVATGHTASDQAETVLYRLAASPGRRALLGMPARDGWLVRPLLDVTRVETAAWCAAHGLAWREDPGNDSPAFARNRVRHGLLEALRAVHPAAEANVLATLAVLRDEAEVLDAAVDGVLADLGDAPPTGGLAALPAALARLAVQRLADRAGAAPPVGPRTEEILRLGARGGSASLDVGGGLRAVVEYGALRFERAEAPPPVAPARLGLPGRAAFAGGEVSGEVGPDLPLGDGTLDAAALAPALEVRAWRPGDRMRPHGLGGSRSLQDLFGDRKIPRARRTRVPVVVSEGEIAWVPGVATGERFAVTRRTRERARLAWRPPA